MDAEFKNFDTNNQIVDREMEQFLDDFIDSKMDSKEDQQIIEEFMAKMGQSKG